MSNPEGHHHKHHRPEPHHTTGHKPKPRVHPALWYGIGVVLTIAAVLVWTMFY